jgi:signal transduction histidine kinase
MIRKYRLTILFFIASLVTIAIAAVIVNLVIGRIAEQNLVTNSEQNTSHQASHIQTMMRKEHTMTLEALSGPDGLSRTIPSFIAGFHVAKFNLFDLNGRVLWSTDQGTVGVTQQESLLFQRAATGGLSSKLVRQHDLTDLQGQRRRLDVVETYAPLQESPSGPIIGVMEIYRDVGSDLTVQVKYAKSAILWTTAGTMGGLFLILAGFVIVADVMINQARRREMALVEAQLAERKRAEEALRGSNTALEAANKELEAFSYSVSHDLRAPLRSIDGFSQALLEDFEDKLDAQGKNYLQRVREGTRRMGQLIEDLLRLSRVTRSEMRWESVDLSGMAGSITSDLQQTQPDRRVEFAISDGMTAKGDPALLRVALENLLSNAWKFTGKNPAAKVEFGLGLQDGRQAYFVRDNGAGFDMAYANKLFGVFQRLHASAEFPGTGIGLAIVQRIMHRHGGRIWAEGEVGEGATFYFTLQGRDASHG